MAGTVSAVRHLSANSSQCDKGGIVARLSAQRCRTLRAGPIRKRSSWHTSECERNGDSDGGSVPAGEDTATKHRCASAEMLRSRRGGCRSVRQRADWAQAGAALRTDAIKRAWPTTAMKARAASAKVRKMRRSECWCLCSMEGRERNVTIIPQTSRRRKRAGGRPEASRVDLGQSLFIATADGNGRR